MSSRIFCFKHILVVNGGKLMIFRVWCNLILWRFFINTPWFPFQITPVVSAVIIQNYSWQRRARKAFSTSRMDTSRFLNQRRFDSRPKWTPSTALDTPPFYKQQIGTWSQPTKEKRAPVRNVKYLCEMNLPTLRLYSLSAELSRGSTI